MKALLTFLNESEMEQIHLATLRVLEETGVSIHSDKVIAQLVKNGAKATGSVVRFPRKMVEEAISLINKQVLFAARDQTYDFTIPHKTVTYNSTAGYCPFIYDTPGRPRRQATAGDLAKIARLCGTLDEIDLFWPITMPTEEKNPSMEEICALDTAFRNISKHVECSCASPLAAEWQVRIAQAVAGGEKELRERPLFSAVASPTTPLGFEQCTAEALPILARAGVPVTPMNVPLAGTTAPATFAGAMVITNAEQLATLVILKSFNPDAPMVYSCDTGPANMKTGDITYNNPDYDLFSIASADLARYYQFPCCVSHGGCEDREYSNLGAFVGNIQRIAMSQMTKTDTSIWMGSKDNCLAGSLWDIMLDAEALRYAKIYCKELTVNEETLAVDAIHEVGPKGEFMSCEHTIEHFREELNLTDPQDSYLFREGKNNFIHAALEKAEDLIANAEDCSLDSALSAELDDLMAAARKACSA